MLLIPLCVLGAVASALSSPTVSVSLPLDAQLPLIARVDQHFIWSFNENSFVSSLNEPLKYTTSSLPDWLSFDPTTLAFYGTPTADDDGNPEVAVTAKDTSSEATSKFTLCVTPSLPPTLRLPISEQFHPDNPSLSSVFLLSPNSAVVVNNPALRVPPAWSFSIGFQGATCSGEDGPYYAALQADGSPLPAWITFDADTVTFDGVSPGDHDDTTTQVISLALHATDQPGYSAIVLPFDLVIARHELSNTSGMPTINITASTSFELSLSSPADFSGVLVDGKPIEPSNITSLFLDTSQYSRWLKYEETTRTLSGTPPDDVQSGLRLPVTLSTFFNQSIQTNVTLDVVPSFFTASTLEAIMAEPGQDVHFSLMQYVSKAITNWHDGAKLSASFEPSDAGNYLSLDPETAQLSGTIPASNVPTSDITVTFTAYSQITHSTSHATLVIKLSPSSHKQDNIAKRPSGLSARARRRLTLGLGIAFGTIGALIVFGMFMAAFRRCARVRDTAIGGEEGMRAYTTDEKKWYGIGNESVVSVERGYGWSEKGTRQGRSGSPPKFSSDLDNPFVPTSTPPPAAQRKYGDLGLGRILSRTGSNHHLDTLSPRSAAVMRKGSFIDKIRQTVRTASDKYTRRFSSRRRPFISKPALIIPTRGTVEGLPFDSRSVGGNPFADVDERSFATSAATTFTGSPSSSTGGGSIPTRRADLQAITPREPPFVHFDDTARNNVNDPGPRTNKRDSTDSMSSNSSVRTHAAEAVVYHATRAVSNQSLKGSTNAGVPRPRMMPFTKAGRVRNGSGGGVTERGRVASQTAKVMMKGSGKGRQEEGRSVDDLSVGMHYVQELGGDAKA